MIPADLLDQLREKDPALFQGVIGGFPLKNGKYLSILDMEPPAALAWLPHCLQEAIRARGWHLYQIRNDDLPGLPCFADIIILGHGKEHDIHNEGEGSTEAEALLRAYIAALSASH